MPLHAAACSTLDSNLQSVPLQVTHSCFVVALTNNDLPLDAYARTNNIRVVALVPGPRQPKNVHVCLIPLLRVLRNAAGRRGAPPVPLQLQLAAPDGSFTPLAHVPYAVDVKCDRMASIKVSGVKGPNGCLNCHHCRNQGAHRSGGIKAAPWGLHAAGWPLQSSKLDGSGCN
jgi:hypothetical protein